MAPYRGTSRPLWQFSSQRLASAALQFYFLVKQASFGNHDDVAGAQPDIAFEVEAGFVSLIVELENRLVAVRRPPSHLDTALCSKGTYTAGKSNCLH